METTQWLHVAVQLAGLGQLAVGIGRLGIPHVLRWGDDVAKLRPLTRQVFWTYAGYIWGTNLTGVARQALDPSLDCDSSADSVSPALLERLRLAAGEYADERADTVTEQRHFGWPYKHKARVLMWPLQY